MEDYPQKVQENLNEGSISGWGYYFFFNALHDHNTAHKTGL